MFINFTFSLQSALAVAFLNVYIPAMLGVIVNVLANMKNNPAADFMDQIKVPAMKLISLYIGQVNKKSLFQCQSKLFYVP